TFLIYPAYYTIRLAFYEGSFNFGFSHYLGIDNFKELLTNDKDFLDASKFPPSGALINNLRWVIFYISLSLIIGLGLAVLAVRVRYERAVKTAIFVPMAIAATSVVTIWLFINVIKVFDIIYVMTGGGPGTSSRVIAFTMYEETFLNGRPGYGAAVAVIMLVVLLPVMILNVRRFRSEKVVA